MYGLTRWVGACDFVWPISFKWRRGGARFMNLIAFYEATTQKNIDLIEDYNCPNFSKIFYKLLISYTDYINEYTWKSKI